MGIIEATGMELIDGIDMGMDIGICAAFMEAP
jgi:hypothetical protein